MTITSTQYNADRIVYQASGSYLDSAASPADAVVTLGFVPKYFAWVNETDRVTWEWFVDQPNGTSLKTAANGDRTLDTGDAAFTISSDGTGGQYYSGNFGPPTAANPGTPTTQYEIMQSPPGEKADTTVTVKATALIVQNKQYRWIARG